MVTTLSLAVTGVAFLATVAAAQAVRFVSANGDDASNCTRGAPCRTLQRGINRAAAGGELQILDSGAYGINVSISKSITISAVGVSATVGNITIDAPGAAVMLRGLLLNGRGAPNPDGIHVADAAAVHIVRCEIELFAEDGIRIESTNTEVFVSDTIARGNGFSGFSASTNGARMTIDNSRFENNGTDGIFVQGSAETMITRVIAAGNASNGIINRNNNSVFTQNSVGLRNIAGILESRVNNTVRANTADDVGTITPLPPK
jgi:hypothetical protein